jgi:hypothetical protein
MAVQLLARRHARRAGANPKLRVSLFNVTLIAVATANAQTKRSTIAMTFLGVNEPELANRMVDKSTIVARITEVQLMCSPLCSAT